MCGHIDKRLMLPCEEFRIKSISILNMCISTGSLTVWNENICNTFIYFKYFHKDIYVPTAAYKIFIAEKFHRMQMTLQ